MQDYFSTLRNTVIPILKQEKTVLWLYIAMMLAATLNQYFMEKWHYDGQTISYTHYNNFVIFKNSFWHLLNDQNLYAWYLTEQWDLFKYSPTFAFCMGIVAYLPDWLGLLLWNFLNWGVLYWAIRECRSLSTPSAYIFVLWFVLIETLTATQNSQSNALIAGLTIAAFNYIEKDRLFWAVGFVVISFYIKIFGVVAGILFLLYPKKLPKTILYGTVWVVLLAVLPLVVVSPTALLQQYQNWVFLLKNDHDASLGFSVLGLLATWLQWYPNKMWVTLIGALLLLLPLVRWRHYQQQYFKLLMLASVLIWVVIFNHKAESPTFVIAMSGVGLWYFAQKQPHSLATLLVILAFIFTSLSPTDIFPRWLREHLVTPYVLKGAFCIFIWVYIQIESLRLQRSSEGNATSN